MKQYLCLDLGVKMSSNISQKLKRKKISAMDSFYQGVIKGIGIDIDFSEAERKNAKRNKMKSAKDFGLWKDAPRTSKEWLNSFKEAGESLFKNQYNNKFDKQGNYYDTDIIKEFAEKGHPENKKITAMAKKFQKEFGNVPMKNWKLADNPRQKTLMPADKSLHSKYEKSIRNFREAWMRDSKKGGWYLP